MVTTFATVNLQITSGCSGWNDYHALIYFNVRELVSLSFNNIGILGREDLMRFVAKISRKEEELVHN